MSDFEKIWLIDTDEAARVWCDSPDPSNGIDHEDVTGPYILNADQRIVELEAEIERLKRGRDRLVSVQEELIEENKRLAPDAERYAKWKENGLSYSDGFYQLELYMYNPDGICEYRDADDVADAAREGK